MTDSRDPRITGFFELFDREKFFEAHEVLEGLWRETRGPDRDFYQGLIQIAACFVHVQNKNPEGARRLLETASAYLGKYPDVHEGIEVKKFLKEVQATVSLNKPFPKKIYARHPNA